MNFLWYKVKEVLSWVEIWWLCRPFECNSLSCSRNQFASLRALWHGVLACCEQPSGDRFTVGIKEWSWYSGRLNPSHQYATVAGMDCSYTAGWISWFLTLPSKCCKRNQLNCNVCFLFLSWWQWQQTWSASLAYLLQVEEMLFCKT